MIGSPMRSEMCEVGWRVHMELSAETEMASYLGLPFATSFVQQIRTPAIDCR
jgi:hypothetical protein